MKKLMVVWLCGCLWGAAQAELTLTNADFEANTSQTSNVTDWYDAVTENTNNWWESTWAGPNVSPNGTSVLGLSYMFTTTNWAYQGIGVNDQGWGGMEVSFDVGSFTDAGAVRDLGVTVSVYESDGTFVPADNTDIDGAAGVTLIDSVSVMNTMEVGAVTPESVILDLRTAGTGELFLHFENYTGETGEPWTAIDNITLTRVDFALENTAPANGTVNVPIELTAAGNDLVFNINEAGITKVDVQFGTEGDPNLTNLAAYKLVDGMAVTPGQYTVSLESLSANLEYEKTYYWKVIGYEPNLAPGATDYTLIPGPVWNFTTRPQRAVVSGVSPAYTAVDPATAPDVVLSVEGVSVDAYQWYKVGDPDLLLTEGADYSGVNTDTLTLLDVDLSDEGYYYCVVTNSISSMASDPGRVMTWRLANYWPLDSDNAAVVDGNEIQADIAGGYDMVLVSEAVEGSDDGLDYPVLTANVVDPVVGNESLGFNNSDMADPNNAWGQYALIEPDVALYEDITLELWVFWNGGANWQRLFDFGNGTGEYMFLSPNAAGTNLRFVISVAGEQSVQADLLPTDEWVHVAVTLGDSTARLYVNGELAATNTAFTHDPIDVTMAVNYIAYSQYEADPYFNGLIDDFKIYNYARTTEQVALDYLAVRGEYVCNNEAQALVYDYNGDCLVDLADFSMFVSEWLDTNRIYAP